MSRDGMTVEPSGLSDSEPAAAERHAPHRVSSVYLIACVAGVVGLLALLYHQSTAYLFQEWMENEDYGHGLFVPLISLALIWWRREQLLTVGYSPTWWGLLPIGLGVALFIAGELATLFVLQHLSLWCVLVGLVLSMTGLQATRRMAFPLGYLLAAIPPPHMVQQSLSSSLQLISSALGVGWLQLIDVTAFREGNVIDLGPIQLQVVEACSGLRYLFPLLALTVLCAYLFQDRMWRRVILVASTVPLAVLLNGLRIGMIGVLVEHFGKGAAEGFMHFFEGWFLFMLSLALLGMELWLLGKIGTGARGADAPRPAEERRPSPVMTQFSLSVGGPGLACAAVLAATLAASWLISAQEAIPPLRHNFLDFPMQLAGRNGESMAMERQYIEALRFDDYLLADYQGPGGPINVYAAYYRSQRSGQATHSPKTCIPGGGWEIVSHEEVAVPTDQRAGSGLRVNRVVIQKGNQKQVVLYWFKQRNRLVTDEFLVKAFLLWDAITMRRSDGALIRLVTAVRPGEPEAAADERVLQMAAAVHPLMSDYVPD